MSVLFQFSGGSFVIDLFVDECPQNSKNVLKLCKMKKYNNCLFFDVQRKFMVRSGDPTGTSNGSNSALGYLRNPVETIYIKDEFGSNNKALKSGFVCMNNLGVENTNTSQFFIILRDNDLEYLEGKHTVIGKVVEGFADIKKIFNSVFVDENYRPLQDIRILHTFVLEDPFPDYPEMLDNGYDSPNEDRPIEETVQKRKPYGINISKRKNVSEKDVRKEEAKSRAEVLEMVGDLPDANIKPPENVLFVCKLNPITTDQDLELLFSRFGDIKECEIIKDKETGESLQYAFIEFENEEQCNEAYLKMNNVIVDDRRIKVDFSQSVAKVWNKWTMQARKKRKIV